MVGYERARTGKEAGLRTHMLVSLGSALFVMAAVDVGVAAGRRLARDPGHGRRRRLPRRRGDPETDGPARDPRPHHRGRDLDDRRHRTSAGLGRYGLALIAALLSLLVLAVVPSAQPDDERPRSGKKTRSGGAGGGGNVLQGGDQSVDV